MLWGSLLGLGLWCVYLWTRSRRTLFDARIAPYVRASASDEIARRSVTVTPWPTLERLLAPVVRDASPLLSRYGSPTEQIRTRLRRSGSHLTVEQYRAQQVLCGVAGMGAGLLAALVLSATRQSGVLSLTVLVVVATAGGVIARDALLSRAVAVRRRHILAELPAIADLLALAVSAGEAAAPALERVVRLTDGVMSRELDGALNAVRAGQRLPAALQEMAASLHVPALSRFADGIATAVERGTPLSHVLRAQAQDVRTQRRDALIEEGGKRELAMLVPVVFLILPVTVVFAVFPGLVALRL